MSRLEYPFRIVVSDCSEDVPAGTVPEETVRMLSLRKAQAVYEQFSEPVCVLGSDTMVWADGRIMGKPQNEAEALEMLHRLEDNWHDVYTGIAVVSPEGTVSHVERTAVHMLRIPEESLKAYVRTEEPYDKAGAYAIQGTIGRYIDRIEGCPNNVIGLPLAKVESILREVLQ